MKFSIVAFDLDGTLYPAYRLNIQLVPFLIKERRLMLAMGKARGYLRKTGDYRGDFYEFQAQLMGETLKVPADRVMERVERLIYRGWEPLFNRIRLYPHVRETLDSFKKEGVRMGILSDFPPDKKLENLHIHDYWEAVVCSEKVGRLKPDPASFLELARKMDTDPGQILYVGNSVSYDVKGARLAGMKTALVRPGWKKRLPPLSADFIFFDYRQLRDYVLS